jgi:hypothetical protein
MGDNCDGQDLASCFGSNMLKLLPSWFLGHKNLKETMISQKKTIPQPNFGNTDLGDSKIK